jgi:hypothetical protein
MLMTWLASLPEERKRQLLGQLDQWMMEGSVVSPVAAKLKLADALDGVRASLTPGRSGKVLLVG